MDGNGQRGGSDPRIQLGDEDALSRGEILMKGALATGALYGLGAIGPYVRRALAADEGGDAAVLNYLLPFEYLQASLYNRVSSEKNDKGEKLPLQKRERELVDLFLKQDGQHVAALKEQIEKMGGKPVDKGSYAFAFRVFEQALEIADTIETTSVGAYNGAISRLESDEARELVYSIVQTDARHAATVRIGHKEVPAYYPFDHCVPEQDSILHVVQYTGVYPEEAQAGGEDEEGSS